MSPNVLTHQIVHNCHQVTVLMSLTFNTLLIYLIMTKSPKQLGVYKYLMGLTSGFEMVYSLLDVFLQIQHHSYGTVAVVLTHTAKPVSPFTLLVLSSIYWGFFGASLALFGVHFIYRYLVLSENELLASFHSWKIVIWLMIPVSNGVVWILFCYYFCGPNSETSEFVAEDFKEHFGEELSDYVYTGFFLYHFDEQGELVLHYQSIMAMCMLSMNVTCSFSIILYFGFKCYQKINHLMHISNTSSLQSQLFYALVFQTVIPFSCIHLPVALIFSLAIFNIGVGSYSFILSLSIAIYPAVDPLPNLYIIQPYRKAIVGFFFKKSSNVAPPTQVSNVSRNSAVSIL